MMKLTVYFLVVSQLLVFGTLDRIQKAMEKGEYQKAYELIVRGYEKEPDNPGVSYYHAQLLFNQAYEKYNLDSARIVVEIAVEKYDMASQDLRDEITGDGITYVNIIQLHEEIRDTTFKQVMSSLSVKAAKDFQHKFPNSIYEALLIYKVDSMEFRQAKLAQSQNALVNFMENHPVSIFKPKADSILDGMRFIDLKEKGNLKDYYIFLEHYPSTRHRNKVESYILRASTASHRKEKYEDFISFSKSDPLRKRAADVLYYLGNKEELHIHPRQDSLSDLQPLRQTELYPVIQSGLYGFFDREGQEKIDALYSGIDPDYKCKLIKDDWIFVKDQNQGIILTKKGEVALQGIDDYRSISDDIGIVEQNRNWFLYHKSGFRILEQPIEDAQVIGNKWIKVKRENLWGLVTFMGLEVAEIKYDEILKMESFWIFEKDDLLAVYTEDLILSEIEDRGLSLEFKFDDIELVDKNALIGFRGETECLLDSTLNFLIPWGSYEIYPEEAGWYLKSDKGYRLYKKSEADLMDGHFSYLESNDGWLTLKTEDGWVLVPRRGNLQPSLDYDSIKLINNFSALLIKEDKKILQFTSGRNILIEDHQIQTFQNHEEYLSVQKNEIMSIFNSLGEEVISAKFQSASFANDSLIKVQIKNKQGLIHINGDWVLNPVFNSIDEKNGLILTLFDGKIGCYDPSISELIHAEYEARIEQFGENYLAKKEGRYGIIDHAKNEVLSFSYDEITFWNDTSYLVKKDGQVLIINEMEEPVYEVMENVRLLISNGQQDIYRFVRSGKYGLISNKNGELLSPEFTDVFNIGSEENPLIFADQHLDKAGFHVVSYVDEKGQLIHSKAYTRKEYEGILCDD